MNQFTLYGQEGKQISFEDILRDEIETSMYYARAERAASEGCCVEIAKWNDKACEWQRYAFLTCLGGEFPESPDANAVETARLFCFMITPSDECANIVHRLPNYRDEEFEDLDRDYYPETAEKLLADSSISHWLRNALVSALDRDCVDAANDAECLAAVLKARCETAAASV